MPKDVDVTEDTGVSIAVRQRVASPEESSPVAEEQAIESPVAEQKDAEKLAPTRGVTLQPIESSSEQAAQVAKPVERIVETVSESDKPSEDVKKPEKDAQKTEVDTAAVVSELVASKKYFLPIKEKRYGSLFRLEQNKKKSAQKQQKKKKSDQQAKIPKVIKKRSVVGTAAGLMVGIVLIVVGLYLAIDFKLIDVGWTPPFSIANR